MVTHFGPPNVDYHVERLQEIANGRELREGDFIARAGKTFRVRAWYPNVLTEELAAFCALIAAQERDYYDRIRFHIAGVTSAGEVLPRMVIPADRYQSMAWAINAWGAKAILAAGMSRKMAEASLRLSAASGPAGAEGAT